MFYLSIECKANIINFSYNQNYTAWGNIVTIIETKI